MWFFITTSLLGFIANSMAVNLPIVVPFLIGNIAFLIILLRLGFIWSSLSLLIVCLPLNSDIVWLNSILQLLCFMSVKPNTKHTLWRLLFIYTIGITVLYLAFDYGLLIDSALMIICTALLNCCVFALCIKTTSMLDAIAISPAKQQHQSLKLQLTHRIGLYSAVPGTILIAFILQGAIDMHLSSQLQYIDRKQDVFINNIQRQLVRYLSQAEFVASLGRDNITKHILQNLTEQQPEFISALLTDAEGNITLFYKADLPDTGIQHSSVADRSYFIQPKALMQSYVSETFQGRTLGKDLLFAVSAPLYKNTAFDGVVEISVDLATLTNSLMPSKNMATNRILLDSENKKIWGSDTLGQLGNVWTERPLLPPEQASWFKTLFLTPITSMRFTADSRYVVIRKPLNGVKWSAHYYLETTPFAIRYFIYLVIAMLCALLLLQYIRVLAGRFIHNYTDTLEKIAQHAHQWQSETPETPALTFNQTALEFEMLSDSLNGMQKRVIASRQAMINSMAEVKLLNNELEHRVKERTQQLEQERDKAKQLAAIKTRFLANMSHEIRTPITIIKGFTEELLAETHGDIHHTLLRINQNTLHLQNVINDILDTAKIDEGKMTMSFEPIEITPFLNNVIDSTLQLAQQKRLTFNCDLSQARQLTVMADPFRLQQILLNLLSNAIKFTAHGTITLKAEKYDDTLAIKVIDEGIGISEQQQLQLFDAFTQADSSTSRQYGGTGLGLYISKKLADAMNITLSLTSQIGKGTTFILTFNSTAISSRDLSIAEATLPPVEISQNTLSGKLLIVDDVADIRLLLASYVKQSNMELLFAENGQQAIEAAVSQKPDIIIMDQQMHVMDGYSAAVKLRKQGINVPIISLSADVFEDEPVEGKSTPFTATLTKPIAKSQLLEVIAKLLTHKEIGMPAANSIANKIEHSVDEDEDLQQAYLNSLQNLPGEISSLVKAADQDGIIRLLHKVKGTSACFGLTEISNAANDAQRDLKTGFTIEQVCDTFIMALNKSIAAGG